jgi:hypothetical protein
MASEGLGFRLIECNSQMIVRRPGQIGTISCHGGGTSNRQEPPLRRGLISAHPAGMEAPRHRVKPISRGGVQMGKTVNTCIQLFLFDSNRNRGPRRGIPKKAGQRCLGPDLSAVGA